MTYLRAACLSLLLVGSASTASAQLMVLGKGNAALCYEYSENGNKGTYNALQTCDAALDEPLNQKDRASTLVNRGILYMRKGDQETATKNYKAAIEIKDDLTEAYVNMGASYIHQDRFEEALTALNRALEDVESKTRPAALVNRAIAFDRQDKFDAAYRDLKTAQVLAPEWDMIDTMLARYTVVPKS